MEKKLYHQYYMLLVLSIRNNNVVINGNGVSLNQVFFSYEVTVKVCNK